MAEETELLLIPAPGAPAEFLATVVPMETGESTDASSSTVQLPFEIQLDNYTRETWSLLQQRNDNNIPWEKKALTTADARSAKKLHGFLKYLKERKKSSSAKLRLEGEDGRQSVGCFLIPYDQPDTMMESNHRSYSKDPDNAKIQFVGKFLRDRSILANALAQKQASKQQQQQARKSLAIKQQQHQQQH
mmetsp:Transcript_9599/g.14295  ORF Transcript_9599/g.14295 Transcript_9599/m.14295 type:complete len:189 (-) Transcript_9599:303-869(-)